MRGRRPEEEVVVQRDIPILMPDGVTLLADRYRPPGSDPLPVVLIRSPYGRGRG
jgi:predicted acyl esterase